MIAQPGARPSQRLTQLADYCAYHAVTSAAAAGLALVGTAPLMNEQFRRPLLPATLVVMIAFALAWYWFAPRMLPTHTRLLLAGILQLALASIAVGLTGGAQSPLTFLYYPSLVLAGLGLGPTHALLVATMGSLGLVAAGSAAEPGSVFVASAAGWAHVVAFYLLALLPAVIGQRLDERSRAIMEAAEQAEELSNVDSLTSLYNRRHFESLFPQEFARAQRYDRPLALLMVDSDNLKHVNDTYGHHEGDQLLRRVAEVIRNQIRVVDTAIRLGGDEFIVILPDTGVEGALGPAERIRASMDDEPLHVDGKSVPSTVSLGVAAFPVHASTSDQLAARVDEALYESKKTGRNRVTVYTGDPESQPVSG